MNERTKYLYSDNEMLDMNDDKTIIFTKISGGCITRQKNNHKYGYSINTVW
jgi:hypothetical protein